MLEWFAEQPAEVKVAVVAMVSAVVVALIQHYRGKPSKTAEVAGAIVDNSAINKLATAIEGLTEEVHSAKGAASRMADQIDDSLKRHGDQVAQLREEMIRRSGRE